MTTELSDQGLRWWGARGFEQASVYPDMFSSESENELWVWMQAAGGIAYAVFLVALGSYVVLWLALREESS